MMLKATSAKIGARAQVSRTRAVAVRAQSKDAPAPLTRALGAAAASIVAAATLMGGAANAADLALGKSVFEGNCAACHAGGQNNVIPDHTLQKAAIEQFLDGGFNLESIVYQVENGKGAMPAWEGRLSDEEIDAVANYVYDQAANNKW
ncbi:cytochrome c6 [Raphidocelis subcapitata]|uniref:Cytochrome c-553 n=1 Tax=Raphidocelis subcapitata TaxID=307507 RepID=A0A2V0P3P5_9CHLO|nr:cytochrome c6 [Raphidocelis subcapitata]|eukprot:GBF92470.1 cytochrome c6 [Raphidocelis subcapitata]